MFRAAFIQHFDLTQTETFLDFATSFNLPFDPRTMSENITPSLTETNGNTYDAAPRSASNWVPVSEAPVFKPRKLRIVCLGAGYSGLMLAYKWKYETSME